MLKVYLKFNSGIKRLFQPIPHKDISKEVLGLGVALKGKERVYSLLWYATLNTWNNS